MLIILATLVPLLLLPLTFVVCVIAQRLPQRPSPLQTFLDSCRSQDVPCVVQITRPMRRVAA